MKTLFLFVRYRKVGMTSQNEVILLFIIFLLCGLDKVFSEDEIENNSLNCACIAPQIGNPINNGECCDPNENDPTKCACMAPQIDDPVNTGHCCNDSGDGATCLGTLQ